MEIRVGAYGKDGRHCQSKALLDFRDAIVKEISHIHLVKLMKIGFEKIWFLKI